MDGRKAAWLDSEILWVPEPSLFELERLGLGKTDVILVDKQVDLVLDAGDGIITVRYIDIVSMDREQKQLSYRVRGATRLKQHWDVGGANLSPSYDREILT